MATNYITIHDLAETTSGNVSEDAEFIINNGTDAVVATKAKLSSILAETKADIANLDGDIANVEADVIELQNDKMNIDHSNDSKPYVTEQYDDGNGNGYRVWSNKFCEQWGNFQSNDGTINTVTFLKEWKDDKYNPIVGMMYGNSGNASYWVFAILSKTEINMNVQNATNGTGNVCYWTAKGYIL